MPEVSDIMCVHTQRRFEGKVPTVVQRTRWKEYSVLISMPECFVDVLVIGEGTAERCLPFL